MSSVGEVALTAVCEPASYLIAMKSLERSMWEAAIQAEYLSLTSNYIWELVPYSKDMKIIGSMWKFKLKRDKKGTSKYKVPYKISFVMGTAKKNASENCPSSKSRPFAALQENKIYLMR